jgi:hypothetical protein
MKTRLSRKKSKKMKTITRRTKKSSKFTRRKNRKSTKLHRKNRKKQTYGGGKTPQEQINSDKKYALKLAIEENKKKKDDQLLHKTQDSTIVKSQNMKQEVANPPLIEQKIDAESQSVTQIEKEIDKTKVQEDLGEQEVESGEQEEESGKQEEELGKQEVESGKQEVESGEQEEKTARTLTQEDKENIKLYYKILDLFVCCSLIQYDAFCFIKYDNKKKLLTNDYDNNGMIDNINNFYNRENKWVVAKKKSNTGSKNNFTEFRILSKECSKNITGKILSTLADKFLVDNDQNPIWVNSIPNLYKYITSSSKKVPVIKIPIQNMISSASNVDQKDKTYIDTLLDDPNHISRKITEINAITPDAKTKLDELKEILGKDNVIDYIFLHFLKNNLKMGSSYEQYIQDGYLSGVIVSLNSSDKSRMFSSSNKNDNEWLTAYEKRTKSSIDIKKYYPDGPSYIQLYKKNGTTIVEGDYSNIICIPNYLMIRLFELGEFEFDVMKDTSIKTTESGTTESGTTESGTRESGTTESGTTESGTTESGTTESGTRESGTRESGTRESGTTESGTTESGTTESRTGVSKNIDCYSSYDSSNPKIAACLLSESLSGVISKKGGLSKNKKTCKRYN